MAQPTFVDLFGTGTAFNAGSNKFEIPKTALELAGINDAATATPIEIYGAIIKIAHSWLVANTDETVLATSSLSVSAPYSRGGANKTSFTYLTQFFGAYNAPIFDPDDL